MHRILQNRFSKELCNLNISLLFLVFIVICIGIVFKAEGQELPNDYDKLLLKTQDFGSVRIIVRLNKTFMPEGMLARPVEVTDQRSRISEIQDELLHSLSKYNVKGIKKFKYIPYIAIEVDSTALMMLSDNPLVLSIVEDVLVPPLLNESVPLINASDAWALGYTGAGWTVAILDTGVDKTHSFFSGGKVVSEACFSTTSAAYNSTTLCPNGQESQIGSGAGVNCSTTIIGCGHGTHVAGIAAGKSDSVNGVAKDAEIIPIQVFSRIDDVLSCDGYPICILSWLSDQILGLEHVYSLRTTYNIASVNMSLGSGWYPTYCDSDSRKAAIDNLRSAGIATVISSGNDGYCTGISAPACISTAVSVGATTKADQEWYYNNYHPTLMSLFAPGVSIYSSVPNNGWAYGSGTSMAAPHVAGAWAILKQKSPSASVDDVLNVFKNTGVPITSPCDGNQKPRIDVLAALNALPDTPPVANFSASPTSGDAPLTVNFTDLSTDDPTSWLWDFGDGRTSTEQNPSYTYQNPGDYTVSLIAFNGGGSDTETKTNYITVNTCSFAPVKLNTQYFNEIQTAYNNASFGDTIEVQALDFTKDLIFNSNITFKLSGGYNCDYMVNPGYTTVTGSITIGNGTMIADKIIIK